MEQRKKRILLVGESSSSLNSGFSIQSYEILKYLYNTNKFEIFELARYCSWNEPKLLNVPWKVYTCEPHPKDDFGQWRYKNSPDAQFGEAVFEQTLLDCKCDVVFDFTDIFMSSFENESP